VRMKAGWNWLREDESWMELAKDLIKWRTLITVSLNLRILLQKCQFNYL
jgi:hypothetical protein